VRKLLNSDADVERIEREAHAAKEAGVDGVPCFIFGNVLAVAGAQEPAYLADAMGRAAAEYAKRGAAPEAPAEAPARMSSKAGN
jgi:predicted DsbA family dithiol-disulfide isomerase